VCVELLTLGAKRKKINQFYFVYKLHFELIGAKVIVATKFLIRLQTLSGTLFGDGGSYNAA